MSRAGAILTGLGDAVRGAGDRLSGTPGTVARGVGAGLSLVGDLIDLGQDPAARLDVVRDLDQELAARKAAREERRRRAVEAAARRP